MARTRSEQPAAEAAFEIDNDAPAPPPTTPADEPVMHGEPEPLPLELVTEPGPKKRIVFEGTGEPAPEPEAPPMQEKAAREPAPSYASFSVASRGPPLRTRDQLDDIHSRIDSLGRPDPAFAGRPARANLQPPGTRSRTLYTTEQGNEVRIYDGPIPTLTLTHRRGQRVEERPFDEALVDQVIGRAPSSKPDAEPEGPAETAPSNGEARPKRRFGLFGRKRTEEGSAETGPETEVPIASIESAPEPARMNSFRPVTVESVSEGWDPSEGSHAILADDASDHHAETFTRTTTTSSRTSRTSASARSGKRGTSSKRAADSTGRKRSK